jgi:restriction endonuclease S subunit
MENPKIRFKGFTKDWEQRKLGATNTFFTDGNYGEAYPKSSDMTDSGSGVPFLTGGNLKDGKLSLDGASYITPEKHSKLTSGHLLEDDIVIAVRGSLGALGYVNTDNSGWNINSQLAILRTDKSELYGKFLIQYLLSWTGQNELLKRQTGSALKQLPIGAIKDVEVPITSIAEQEKIGEYFDSVDHLITLHQRKCEQTKKLKKYMLQKMFPQNGAKVPEIRFDGFTYDWEQRKLGDVFEQTSNLVNPKEDEIELWSLTVEDGLTKKSDRYNREFLVKKDDNFKEVRPGDIVYNPMNMTLGAVGYNGMAKSVAVSGYYTTMVAKENYDTYYINTWLKSPQAIRLYRTYATGSLIEKQRVQFPTLSIIPVTFPKYEEQIKIGSYFHSIDNLITLHQRKCDELKKMKKYMLQNMFI